MTSLHLTSSLVFTFLKQQDLDVSVWHRLYLTGPEGRVCSVEDYRSLSLSPELAMQRLLQELRSNKYYFNRLLF